MSRLLSLALSNTRYLVSVPTVAAAVVTQRPHVIIFLLGALVNAFVGKVVKTAVDLPRPLHGQPEERRRLGLVHYPKDSGMPSSHSQSLFFFVAYFTLQLVQPTVHDGPWVGESEWTRAVGTLAAGVFATVSCAYRVHKRYHSTVQIIAGLALGATAALVWRRVVLKMLREREYQMHSDGLRATVALWLCVGIAGVALIALRQFLKWRGGKRKGL